MLKIQKNSSIVDRLPEPTSLPDGIRRDDRYVP